VRLGMAQCFYKLGETATAKEAFEHGARANRSQSQPPFPPPRTMLWRACPCVQCRAADGPNIAPAPFCVALRERDGFAFEACG
jgi:hypothetical protein